MKSFLSKYTQQLVVGLLILATGAGIMSAGSTNYSAQVVQTITSGFVRIATEGLGYFKYGYGFGYISNLVGYGYGYGYDAGDWFFAQDEQYGGDRRFLELFGFGGTEGSAVIDSLTSLPNDYGFEISYSTNYLAKTLIVYSINDTFTTYTLANQESEFTSGARSYIVTGLNCDTVYFVAVNAIDAGENNWQSPVYSVATKSCNDSTSSTTGAPSAGRFISPTQQLAGREVPIPQINSNLPKPTNLPISPVLRQGASGPGPRLLQRALNYLGFTVAQTGAGSPGNETEFFGPKTRAALKEFQATYGLTADGIYGPVTKRLIEILIK
jgi:hypothetical protein